MTHQTEPDPLTLRITAIIRDDIRPWIEIDGGRIEFVRYEDGIVHVRLGGACRGCPATALTLKGGVERRLREQVREVREVRMVEHDEKNGPEVDLSSFSL